MIQKNVSMESVKNLTGFSLTKPTPEELFSPMEVYHENSKIQPSDFELLAKVAKVNSSPEIRGLITRPVVNYPGHHSVALPKEFPPSPIPFEAIVTNRRSEHKFSAKPIDLASLAKVLFLGDGIVTKKTVEEGNGFSLRTAPSGGGLYPVELYCFSLRVNDLSAGSYFYNPAQHQLELLKEGDFSTALGDATFLRREAQGAAACIALVGVLPRSSFKYGQRAYRFLLLEAGHIGQNILLVTESLGLGALPVGGFIDDRINMLLSLDGCNEFAIYILLIGGKAS
jgi:SagB-type dehydrogenase family enzyme